MLFVSLAKLRGKITPAFQEATAKALKNPPPGLIIRNVFWLLGEYDFLILYEARDEKAALRMAIPWGEFCETQTMVAIPNEEAQQLLR
jgi:uncharacterized protein with GYD domain